MNKFLKTFTSLYPVKKDQLFFVNWQFTDLAKNYTLFNNINKTNEVRGFIDPTDANF